MSKKIIELDKEAKILLLNVLKRGYFEETDIDVLERKGCFATTNPFRQMRKNKGIED